VKKILVLAALAVLIVYGAGAVLLSERATNRFLDDLELLSLRGHMPEFCARLHDDLEVRIEDRTSPGFPRDLAGGKREYCDFVTYAMKGVDIIGLETAVTRQHYSVERSWLHPWTALVSYHEVRTSRMTRVNATLHTESDDRWELVLTASGVQVRRLESRSKIGS
jgi:hypothetical protein